MIVGQSKLLKLIDTYNASNLPQSILLLGEKGSGKNTIAQFIATKFNLGVILLNDYINDGDFIFNIQNNATPTAYIVDVDDLSEKEQNKILKLAEEPSVNSYVILTAINKDRIINTLLSRCTIWEMDKYSKDELKNFSKNDFDEKIFNTPGLILNFNFDTLEKTEKLANTVLIKLINASLANTLTIADKFNYKDEYDKIDIYVYLRVFLNDAIQYYANHKECSYVLKYMELTTELLYNLNDIRYNKRYLIDNYLTNMWRSSRDGY